MNNKSILFFLPASQFNEIEFTVTKKILKDSGIASFIASDALNLCIGDSGLKVKADVNLYNVHENNFCGFVLIGGKGTKLYWESLLLHKIANNFVNKGKIVAAICNAPIILAKAGVLTNHTATCNFENKMELISAGIDYKDTDVVISKNIITGSKPAAAYEFGSNILYQILR